MWHGSGAGLRVTSGSGIPKATTGRGTKEEAGRNRTTPTAWTLRSLHSLLSWWCHGHHWLVHSQRTVFHGTRMFPNCSYMTCPFMPSSDFLKGIPSPKFKKEYLCHFLMIFMNKALHSPRNTVYHSFLENGPLCWYSLVAHETSFFFFNISYYTQQMLSVLKYLQRMILPFKFFPLTFGYNEKSTIK